jgi:hypothetical protein
MSNPYLDFANSLIESMATGLTQTTFAGAPRYLAQAIGPAGAEYDIGKFATIAAANAALDQLDMGNVITQVIDLDDPESGDVSGVEA